IRAVADQNALRIDIQNPPCGIAKIRSERIRIFPQPISSNQRLPDGGQHPRRSWVWIFVGVELNNAVSPRLFPRRVARHSTDIGAKLVNHAMTPKLQEPNPKNPKEIFLPWFLKLG